MLRKSAVTLAILTAMQTVNANALGLGEVTVKSALNQPLRAEINLLQVRDLSESQIIASLADSDDFYLAGVKPVAILSDLTFDLDIDNGKGVIRLSSSEPIREPFLNFLVEVNWPSGRLVREYTVLLDPPVFSANDLKPRPVAPAVTEPKSQTVRPAPVMPKKPAPKPLQMPTTSQGSVMPAPAQSSMSGDMGASASTYKVGKNDTLWRIAIDTRPDSSVSPQQMMLAIQRANPDAFFDNNINKLKSGAVLNIPGKQEVLAIGAREAVTSVQDQNAAWKGASDSQMDAQKKTQQLDATKNGSSGLASSDENVESQLRILSQPDVQVAEDEAVSADSMANEGSDPEVETEQLENQLVVTLENVDKLERDNADLSGEVDLLNEQLALQDEKIKLQDQKIAELEAMLKKLSQASPAPAAAPQPVPAPVPAAPEKSFVDKLLASPAMLGGGVVAILAVLLGGFFVARKRRNEDDEAAVEEAMVALDERDSMGEEALGGAEKVSDNDDDISAEFDSLIADDSDDAEPAGSALDMDVDIDEPVAEDAEMADFADSLLDDDEYDLSVDEDIVVEDGAVEEDSVEDVDSSDLDMLLGGNDAIDLDDDDDLGEADDAADLADVGIDSLETESGLDTIDPIDDEPLEPVDDSALDDILSEVEEGEDDDGLDFEISEPVDLEITADEEIDDLEPVGISLDDDVDDELDAGLEYPEPEAESESVSDVAEPVAAVVADTDLDFDLGGDDDLAELGISDDDDLEAQLEEMLGEDGNELELDETSEAAEEGGDEEDEDVDYLDAADELGTKLDLARAYIDMDDVEGAKEILQEVLGSEDKDLQAEAQKLLDELGSDENV